MTDAAAAAREVAFRPLTVRIPDACRMTGISRSKIYELIESGDIPIIKVGRMTLLPVSGLEAFLGLKPAK